MSTLKTTNLQNASAASPAITLAADGSATAKLSSVNGGPIAGTRNRIINGDMRIDQRNAGASVTPVTLEYQIDRWRYFASQSSKITMGQNQGAVTPPAGFSNYLGITSSSAYSVLSTENFGYQQFVEGFNAADLAWGTANAQTVTLSFWVRSSLTGTFGGSIQNSATNRSYPFSYTIGAANTWEQKSVTIAGDTTGTWLTTNGRGIGVNLMVGVGSTLSGTAGAWAAADYRSATGATSVVGTNGATFYITGVQLEPGTVATPFERRSYGQELYLCQRYYQKNGVAAVGWLRTAKSRESDRQRMCQPQFPCQMRATPTVVITDADTDGSPNSFGVSLVSPFGFYANILASADGQIPGIQIYTASAEL